MGLRCWFGGHQWDIIFSKEKSYVTHYLVANKPDRKGSGTLIVEACKCCDAVKAKLADSLGNCQSVDVEAAICEMKEDLKKKKAKKVIPVTNFQGQIGFSTKKLNLKSGEYEAHVFDDRIEIRRVSASKN